MKAQQLRPDWKYSIGTDGIHQTQDIHVVVWSKEMCIAGFSDVGRLTIAKSYQIQTQGYKQQMNRILIDEPLLSDAGRIRRIWISNERMMLVPQEFYQEQTAENWIKKIYFVENDEIVIKDWMKQHNVYSLQIIQKDIHEFLVSYFPVAKIQILSKALLPNIQDSVLHVYILDSVVSLTWISENKLQKHICKQFETVDDLMYSLCNELKFLPNILNKLQLILGGFSTHMETIAIELASYFQNYTIETIDTITLHFFNQLYSCE